MSHYPGLASVTDPILRQALKILHDKIGAVEVATAKIGTVSAPLTTHLNANAQQLKAVADPTAPQDAVTLKYLQHYVESRTTQVLAATATTPVGTGTPPSVTPPPPPGPTGPPAGGGVLTHGFDLSTATVYNSPADIASWPATGTISAVSMFPGVGVYVTCSKVSAPNSAPPPLPGLWPQPSTGESAGIQYTLWMVVKISGTWYTSGFILMWVGRPGTGSQPIGNEFATLWAYDTRWGAMNGYSPAPGTQVGFFLSAGAARGFTDVNTVRERSEVVLLNLPDANGATYT